VGHVTSFADAATAIAAKRHTISAEKNVGNVSTTVRPENGRTFL